MGQGRQTGCPGRPRRRAHKPKTSASLTQRSARLPSRRYVVQRLDVAAQNERQLKFCLINRQSCILRIRWAFRSARIRLDDPVILAPMSGVSDLPFRRLVKRLGAGLVVSEMIASEAMIRETRQSMTMAKSCDDEQPMAVQLAGCEPRVMAEAAKLNADRGARIIDINFGCPVKKVVNGHAGSALMRDEAHAARILEATVRAVDLPVTLKMRTGWDEQQPQCAAARAHCRSLRHPHDQRARPHPMPVLRRVGRLEIHPRGQGSSRDPGHRQRRHRDLDDADRALQESGADGLMIGRGCYGRPWFVRQVIEWLKSRRRVPDPPLAAQLEIVLDHYEEMLLITGPPWARGSRASTSPGIRKGFRGRRNFARRSTDHRRRARPAPDPILLRAAVGPRDGMIRTPLRHRGSSEPETALLAGQPSPTRR